MMAVVLQHEDVDWSLSITAAVIWNIWIARNKARFEDAKASPIYYMMKAKKLVENMWREDNGEIVSASSSMEKCRRWVSIRWIPPPVGVFKLNIDGSSRGNPGAAGAGCVLRDWDGRFIFGLAVPILHASTIMAEARALFFGLRILSFLHLNGVRVLVETDSKFIQQCIRHSSMDTPWEVLSMFEVQAHPCSSWDCSYLELKTNLTKWELPGITTMLRTSPNLQTLIIQKDECECLSLDDEFLQKYDFDESSYWSSLLSFPCLENTL
ncbi:hypothetical protein IFM89_002172 [Coptis chinensis]|uniref:RNase H type-1 domain-containing protein n=1 Tax=Coptis chinensis TaxID=261450 RepID=A0A835I871_9MAGN|nr:hypothetical protein IFM89_002172 [Coptis chinensis]